ARDRLRDAAIATCWALAGRLRTEIAFLLAGGDPQVAADRNRAAAVADEAAESLQRTFLATPYRPNGLGTSARTITRLVVELGWLALVAIKLAHHSAAGVVVSRPAIAVRAAAAVALERGAELLTVTGGSGYDLQAALTELSAALTSLEDHAAAELPTSQVSKLVSALDPAFRARDVGSAASLIATTIGLTAAAERRSWLQRMLGRQPGGLPGALSVAEERAAAHVEPHSLWLRNSIRGGAALGLAVLVASLT